MLLCEVARYVARVNGWGQYAKTAIVPNKNEHQASRIQLRECPISNSELWSEKCENFELRMQISHLIFNNTYGTICI